MIGDWGISYKVALRQMSAGSTEHLALMYDVPVSFSDHPSFIYILFVVVHIYIYETSYPIRQCATQSGREISLARFIEKQQLVCGNKVGNQFIAHVVFREVSWETLFRHRSGSTLAQVMACCLTAPSHYLNQCWLIISKVQWHSSENNCTRDSSAPNH